MVSMDKVSKNDLDVKPEMILPIRRIYQEPPCSERCFNFSFIFEFGKWLKTCMIISFNAVRCHPLRKNLWNHVTWMSYSQSTGARKRVESVKNVYFISKNLYINICHIPILGRDIVSRARFQDTHKLHFINSFIIYTPLPNPKCFNNIYMYAFSKRFYPKRLTVHLGYTFFCQYVCSLGIEPTTFCAANTMLYHWATGTLL